MLNEKYLSVVISLINKDMFCVFEAGFVVFLLIGQLVFVMLYDFHTQ
jgi:hypothetical protein